MYLDKTAAIARLFPNSDDADKEQYATVAGYENVKINVQPADAELVAISEGQFGQTYRAFVSVSGIIVGDRITISGINDVYIVKGVQNWSFGFIPHLELILFKGDA